jgi:hypothetical protein
MRKTAEQKYFENFFNEKQLPYESFEIEQLLKLNKRVYNRAPLCYNKRVVRQGKQNNLEE